MTNMETKLSDLELITSVLIEATKNVEEIYFQLPVAGQKPYVSDKMMPHLFERIAPPWAQSEMTITLSLGEFAGRKYDACAISAQEKMKYVAQKSPAATNARSAAASRALVADGNGKNAVAFASVSGTAAVVALRRRSSRLSAYASLYRPPNR